MTTIRRTFRTNSYSNEVGHFVSCSEYVATSKYFVGTLRDLIGDTSGRDRQNIDGIIVIDNRMQMEIIFVVEFENEKLWDR